MTYTNEQFKKLASFEVNFTQATVSRFATNPGRSALQTIVLTYKEATGRQLPTNFSCQSCILDILRTAGRAWLDDKAEREAAVLEARRASLDESAKTAEISKISEKAGESSAASKKSAKTKKTTQK